MQYQLGVNPTSYGISVSVSWKESFWTLYCYRPFVNRDIKRSHAKTETKISKIEWDIEICKLWDNKIFSFRWHKKIRVLRYRAHLLELVLILCDSKIIFCKLSSTKFLENFLFLAHENRRNSLNFRDTELIFWI